MGTNTAVYFLNHESYWATLMSCQPKINTKTIKKILKVAGILHQSQSCKRALVQNSAEQGAQAGQRWPHLSGAYLVTVPEYVS